MSDAPQAADPVAEQEPAPRGTRRRAIWRWTRRLFAVALAILAAVVVSFFSIDLGRFPALKNIAEREAGKYFEVPVHIGRIHALITPGKFALDDFVIEAKAPGTRPFFSAKRIIVSFPWWTLFRKQAFVEVEMTGWKMLVETFPVGNNMPKLTPKGPRGKSSFTTTVPFVYAKDGEFTYEDHATPWSVTAPHLNFEIVRTEALKTYVGHAQFKGGTVQIQKYQPMPTDVNMRFAIEEGKVAVKHLDLVTDGSKSHISGAVDFSHWPEQTYNINSEVDFVRMREIFFERESWRVKGNGGFEGVFHLFKTPEGKNAYTLAGQFTSDDVRVNDWRFADMHGALVWDPTRFEVTHCDSRFLGGNLRFAYGLVPLGAKTPPNARLSADYDDLDLASFIRTPWINWTVLQPEGRLRGRLEMAWPNGKFREGLSGEGDTTITPTGAVASETLPRNAPAIPPEKKFDPARVPGRFPLAAEMHYHFTSNSLDFSPGTAATPTEFVRFSGHAVGGDVKMAFHVTSHDWQASDRLFAGIMAEFDSPTGAIEVGGRGTFDGELTKQFKAPRIAGKFTADDMRAWSVVWGRTEGEVVIEDGFMDIKNGLITKPSGSTIRTDGRYALGYKPGKEEMNGRIAVRSWPLDEFRTAFGLSDWPVDGTLAQGDFQLHGPYQELVGTGKIQIETGVAWGEPFERATADLGFEGDGMRLSRLVMTKGPGEVTGDAWIGWNGTYVFAVDGVRMPVESLNNFKVPQAPLSGVLQFKARGDGRFDAPSYEFDGTVADLYAGDEGIGQVHGKLTMKDDVLTFDRLDAVSNRLQVTGSGSIALNEHRDATLFLRLFDTSLDPYLKFFAPEMSPYTRAIVSGTVDVKGSLLDPADLVVDVRIPDENAKLTLFDYGLHNQGEVRLAFEENTFKIARLVLAGQDTLLDLGGTIDAGNRRVSMDANGTANLAILQGFYPELSAFGAATLNARLQGPFGSTSLTGTANIKGGRLRHSAMPHGLNDINGPIRVDTGRITVDGVTAQLGEGPIVFGGTIALNGYVPEEYNLTARGRSMRLRYPEGLVSTVDATLNLEGPVSTPVLRGLVEVLSSQYRPRVDPESGLFAYATGGVIGAPAAEPAPPLTDAPPSIPLTLDIKVVSPVTAFIDTNTARIEARANLDVGGTADRPQITGHIGIEGGQFFFGENRYRVLPGSMDFLNPQKFEPYFDVAVETRARASGSGGSAQTYTVNVQFRGTFGRLEHTLSADPWLSELQIVSLLFGGTPDIGAATLQPTSTIEQARSIQAASLALLTSPITSTVSSVFREVLPIDVATCSPLLTSPTDDVSIRALTATARCTLVKRISDRVYLTYSRNLTGNQEEIYLLEFDQSDRISWILSRNEDRTWALDFRIRRVF